MKITIELNEITQAAVSERSLRPFKLLKEINTDGLKNSIRKSNGVDLLFMQLIE